MLPPPIAFGMSLSMEKPSEVCIEHWFLLPRPDSWYVLRHSKDSASSGPHAVPAAWSLSPVTAAEVTDLPA